MHNQHQQYATNSSGSFAGVRNMGSGMASGVSRSFGSSAGGGGPSYLEPAALGGGSSFQAFGTPGTPTRSARLESVTETPAKATRAPNLAPKKQRTNHRASTSHHSTKAVVEHYQRQALGDQSANRFGPGNSSSSFVIARRNSGQYAGGGNNGGSATNGATSSYAFQPGRLNSNESFGGVGSGLGGMSSVERHMEGLHMSDTPQHQQQYNSQGLSGYHHNSAMGIGGGGHTLFHTPTSPMSLHHTGMFGQSTQNSFGFGNGGGGGGNTSRGMSPQFLGGGMGFSASQLRASQFSNQHTEHTACSQETTCSQFMSRRIHQDFTEVHELGRGAFGSVLLVQEVFSGDYFAVKVLAPFTNQRDRNRKMQERAILAAIRGYPHCVELFNSWVDGARLPTLHLQLQLCPNGTLADEIQRRRGLGIPWREVEVLTVLGQMGIALDALHTSNIAHVDFKPENVMRDARHNYVLSDFGHAQFLDPQTSRPLPPPQTFGSGGGAMFSSQDGGASMADLAQSVDSVMSLDEGDCRYASVDMLNEKRHFKAGDVFALGLSLYEMMSGEPLPKNGGAYQDLRRRTELNELLDRGYSEELVQTVLWMIQFEPASRPTTREILQLALLRPNDHTRVLNERTVDQWAEVCASEFQHTDDDASGGSNQFSDYVDENGMMVPPPPGYQRQQRQQQQQQPQQQQGNSLDTAIVRFHMTCCEVAQYLLQQLILKVNNINPNPRGAVASTVMQYSSCSGKPLPGQPQLFDDELDVTAMGVGVEAEEGGSNRPSTSTTCAWGGGSSVGGSPDFRSGLRTPVNRTFH